MCTTCWRWTPGEQPSTGGGRYRTRGPDRLLAGLLLGLTSPSALGGVPSGLACRLTGSPADGDARPWHSRDPPASSPPPACSFACARTLHAGFPSAFLWVERFRWALAGVIDDTRPMDAMPLSFDTPAEDEIATGALTGAPAGSAGGNLRQLGPLLGPTCGHGIQPGFSLHLSPGTWFSGYFAASLQAPCLPTCPWCSCGTGTCLMPSTLLRVPARRILPAGTAPCCGSSKR